MGDLNFPKKRELDISGFNPRDKPSVEVEVVETKAADAAAERAGFKSREPVERIVRKPGRKKGEPTDSVYVRGPVPIINRLKLYCDIENMSYGEALEKLMTDAGINDAWIEKHSK